MLSGASGRTAEFLRGKKTIRHTQDQYAGAGQLPTSPVELSGGYRNEKLSWDNSNKTAALSGSVVHGQTDATSYKRVGGTLFDDLSDLEYQQLAAQAGAANQVLYFKKADRFQHMVDIDAQGRLHDMQNQPLNWAIHPLDPARLSTSFRNFQLSLHMYAMDRYGNLFQSAELSGPALTQAAAAVNQAAAAMAKYDHSSFNGGRDVMCAGLIGVQNDLWCGLITTAVITNLGGEILWRRSSDGAAVPADDDSVAIMLDFVNPVAPDRRPWSFNRLSRDDEPGRKRIDFHCREKIGRRRARNNEPGVVFILGLQLIPSAFSIDAHAVGGWERRNAGERKTRGA